MIAWSAGAMALADRIVLFGDRSPQGPGHPEVYGSGLSVLRDVVLLPHARARMLLDDTPRMAVFARRFAPARCVLLDAAPGSSSTAVRHRSGGGWPPGTRVLAEDGHVTAGWRQPDQPSAASRPVSRKLAINRLRERRPLDPAAVDRFLARHEVPIVEGARCTFLYRGEADEVFLVHRIFGLPDRLPLRRLHGTDLWYAGPGAARGLQGGVPAGGGARRAPRADQRPAEPAARAQPGGQFLGLLRPRDTRYPSGRGPIRRRGPGRWPT